MVRPSPKLRPRIDGELLAAGDAAHPLYQLRVLQAVVAGENVPLYAVCMVTSTRRDVVDKVSSGGDSSSDLEPSPRAAIVRSTPSWNMLLSVSDMLSRPLVECFKLASLAVHKLTLDTPVLTL